MPNQWVILFSILLMLATSVFVFVVLLRRHTTGRNETAKWEWCTSHGFKAGELGLVGVPGLDTLPSHHVRILEHYRTGDTSILKLQSFGDQTLENSTPITWHLVIHELSHVGPTVALRPTHQQQSIVDLFDLQVFPKLSSESRFSVHGNAAIEARKLASGPVRALIPSDIGLVRVEDRLILDFTQRPFDPVEFSRLVSVLEQISGLVMGEVLQEAR